MTQLSQEEFQKQYINLAQLRLGSKVVFASDEFFGAKERMLKSTLPEFLAEKFDDHGKWMDGWETRRKRGPGYDFCIVRLGLPGRVRGVNIDTTHFTGNFPPSASLQGIYSPDGTPDNDSTDWQELIPSSPLQGNSHNLFLVQYDQAVTHVRLNIYPDGGVARLRVYGEAFHEWHEKDANAEIDLLAVENGGRAITCNDQHFGSMLNLNMPGRGINMGDGWETRRRREPGNDWVILSLGHAGTISRIEIDTAFFRGNYPYRCSIQAALVRGGTDASLPPQSLYWQELLPPQYMQPDAIHIYEEELVNLGVINYVRMNIYPDGGVSRIRAFGRIAEL